VRDAWCVFVKKMFLPSCSDTPASVEEVIKICLAGFLEKRKASGDARPCGPHAIWDLFTERFSGFSREDLEEERFLFAIGAQLV
jgi:hypothetical protein